MNREDPGSRIQIHRSDSVPGCGRYELIQLLCHGGADVGDHDGARNYAQFGPGRDDEPGVWVDTR